MIKTLELNNVGPSDHLEIDFGDRLTVFTGDNGLGKSFVLDVAWWMLTKEWAGEMAMPEPLIAACSEGEERPQHIIKGTFDSEQQGTVSQRFLFQNLGEIWNLDSQSDASDAKSAPSSDSIVIYMKYDGTIAMYDPLKAQADAFARDVLKGQAKQYKDFFNIRQKNTTRVYSQTDLWDGVKERRRQEFNGLISDWGDWQREGNFPFTCLEKGVKHLSPKGELFSIGKLRRVKADDSRKFPTIKPEYGQETPLIFASAGIKKIISLLYALIWAWNEHVELCSKYVTAPASKIVLMIDEVEAHLHPQWQRSILNSLESVMSSLLVKNDVSTQLICTTHSPLILASLEPIFDERKDVLYTFDVNRTQRKVELKKEEWVKRGSSAAWLTSSVFGLASDSSEQREEAIKEAKLAVRNKVDEEEAKAIHQKLLAALHQADPFWSFWLTRAEKRGWKL